MTAVVSAFLLLTAIESTDSPQQKLLRVLAREKETQMQMILGVIADAANKAEGDKLNLLGVFHDLYAAQLPCVHPQMALAMEFRAAPSDKGRSVRIRVPLLDPDGAQLFQLEINLQIAAEHPALEPVVPFSFNLNNLSFAKEGSHRFEVFVEDELKGDIKLNVTRVAAPPAPA